MATNKYIKVRKSQINYYNKFPLFYASSSGKYLLYKKAGERLDSPRLSKAKHPELYIHENDRLEVIQAIQTEFNKEISKSISDGKVADVKTKLCSLVSETLSEPRSGTLNALPETIDVMIHGYSSQPDIMKTFAAISFKDYTTVIHSVNVMALTMGYCFYNKYSIEETKRLGLSALLHDVGKTEVSLDILTADRKLTAQEFHIMKSHTVIGADIIKSNVEIDSSVIFGALEHHEKLDGSGYPRGITDITPDGQLLSIIDCYEALTNEDRPYRRAKNPFDTLLILKKDLIAGKFNKQFFERFCTSLV